MVTAFTQLMLAAVLIVIMLGMGATVNLADFRAAVAQPKGFLVGLACQFGIMPLIAFGLSTLLDLPDATALSVIIVGSTPGGTTYNLFTYYARGNLALSIAMTVTSTAAAIVLLPLSLTLYGERFTSAEIQIPYSNIIITLLLVLIPVGIGMFVLTWNAQFAKKLERLARAAGILLIIGLIAEAIRTRIDYIVSAEIGLYITVVLMGIIGLSLSYAISRLLGLPTATSRTVSLETGIQNTPLAIAIIVLTFPNSEQQILLATFPGLYAVFTLLLALGLATIYRRIDTQAVFQNA